MTLVRYSPDSLTHDELLTLVNRAYPGGPSGLCSATCTRVGNGVNANCTVCFPDLPALIAEHNRLKQLAWARLRELGEELPR